MEQYQLGEMEERLADLIWEKEPLTSAELVKACGEAFDWKRTTTYTMLKRLIVRGIFVPKFLAAFSKRKKLSDADVAELRKLIDEYEEE